MPYAALGFSDFWRRWHISLSTWLRDYLYIPLGGNRRGGGRTYVNLMATMVIGGLWHGASWTFVAWGTLHGTYLAGERFVKEHTTRWRWPTGLAFKLLLVFLTYLLVDVTWVFFRAKDFASAGAMLGAMFGLHRGAAPLLPTIRVAEVIIALGGVLSTHWLMRERSLEGVVARAPVALIAAVWTSMLVAIVLTQGSGSSFIYFQF